GAGTALARFDSSKFPARSPFPRAATASTVWPPKAAAPSEVQVLPPSFEYKRPFRSPPDPVKKHGPLRQTVPLAVRPVPAIRVLRLGSVGSKARLAIESVACLSVRGVQVTPPLVVDQMPPSTVPMKNLFASSGSAITGPIAPVTSALRMGPKAGAGPWLTKFWFIWTCANAAIGVVKTDARSIQPKSRLITIAPAMQRAHRITQSSVDCGHKQLVNFFLAVLLKGHTMQRCTCKGARTRPLQRGRADAALDAHTRGRSIALISP